MGRKWTPEQRKAASEKMKKLQEQRKELDQIEKQSDTPQEVISSEADKNALERRVIELEATLRDFVSKTQGGGSTEPHPQGPQVTQRGMVGTLDRYVVDPKQYPDPCERLAAEPFLKRFAFTENYELEWEVSSVSYETIDGIRMREPKFSLNLVRIVYDEMTNEPTNKRYYVRKSIFHEDPEAAIVVAREHGIAVDQTNEKFFLDEMRYLRFRDWLLGIFSPPKPNTKKNTSQVVVDNRLVDLYEVSSEAPQTIPYDKLRKG